LAVDEETQFYNLFHVSGECSPVCLMDQSYKGLNISFRKSDMSGNFCLPAGKVCMMTGKING
jgi:hypothetical protein